MEMLGTFPWSFISSLVVFFLGTCIGSFLNVCIYRIPRDLSTYDPPRSFCPHCQKQIAWFDNLPILSYLLLRGRCRQCSGTISGRYMLVEFLTGLLFLLVWLQFVPLNGRHLFALSPIMDWKLVPIYWLIVSGLILGTFVDFEHLIIPDRVTLGGIVAGLLLSLAAPSLHEETRYLHGLGWAGIGAVIGWGLLWMIAIFGRLLFRKEAMGFGDVKLMGAIGAFLGAKAVFFTVMVSSFVGSIVGITLVVAGQKNMQSRIPYGPYLALAALIWMFWGPSIWLAYLHWLMPPAMPM
jgi:leader peptidase (prepilin peptidase)/N-methyltransferase